MIVRAQRLAVAAASGAIALFAAGTALAQDSGGTFRLRATVPVACWVEPAGAVLAGTGLGGTVVEACNSAGGFTVSASYRPLAGAEKAQMVYGDSKLDLARSGEQVLHRSTMAKIRTVAYRFEEVVLDAPLVMTLTIQPI